LILDYLQAKEEFVMCIYCQWSSLLQF
jgi:hypothetical protein